MSYDRLTSRFQASVRFVVQRGMLKPLVWSLVHVTVRGRENLADVGGAIVVANHSSHLDAPLIFGSLPRRNARYLAAGAASDYFFEVPWRKWLTTLIFNAFAVERNAEGKRKSEARRLLDENVPILLFPEGGRSRAGEFRHYKPGAAALAISSGRPILPIAIVGANTAMPKGTSWPVRGRQPVTVVIGEPMSPQSGERAREMSDRIVARVRELHESVAPVPQQPVSVATGSATEGESR